MSTDLLTKPVGPGVGLAPAAKNHTAVVLKKFFGVRAGDKLQDFAKELKNLTDSDREELTTGILNESFTY